LNLARPFKAGIEEASEVTSRERRLSECFQPSLTRRCLLALAMIPALKDRAKLKPPLRGED
jgi:hypothetical protein